MEKFKTLSINELCLSLCENKKTLIMFHVRPDADAVGSAFALRELLTVMGIQAYCVCSDEMPEKLAFLADGTQGSVLIDDSMRIDYERIISVDSASPSQLGVLFNRLHRDIDIMIDHHASGTVYAANYIDFNAAATGEIIYKIAKKLVSMGKINAIPSRVINCVYAALSSDTGGFKFSNVTASTHKLAAELIKLGAEHTEIDRMLYDSKSIIQIRVEGEAARRLKTCNNGKVAWISIPYSLREELSARDEHLDTVIDIARSLYGVEVSLSIRENADRESYRVSMRSVSDFDVSYVCARFGGGGHKSASGCTVKAASIEEAEQKLIAEIARLWDK